MVRATPVMKKARRKRMARVHRRKQATRQCHTSVTDTVSDFQEDCTPAKRMMIVDTTNEPARARNVKVPKVKRENPLHRQRKSLSYAYNRKQGNVAYRKDKVGKIPRAKNTAKKACGGGD